MPRTRRKLSACRSDFQTELGRLERFDAKNQERFSAQTSPLSKGQLHFLTEAVFFRAFRAYERFVRDVFLLYCLEKRPESGARVKSYLKPRGFLHAEELIKSSMRFLDWTKPDVVIQRAELYLEDGFPIKPVYVVNRDALQDFRRIRNRIAHDSVESLDAYSITLRRYYGAVPLRIPTPGEFLLELDKVDPSKYKLLAFFSLMNSLSTDLT